MTINREHLAGLELALKTLDTEEYMTGQGCRDHIRALIAQAQAAPEAEPVAWVPSAALAKLRNGSNNAPCVLTDSPAEFNDTAVYLAPQHDAELIELLNLAADTLDDVCHGSMLEQTIRAKLATLRHV